MKQKKHNDKRRNIVNIRNKRTASSAAYKPIKRIKQVTKHYQKSNSDNQTDNKNSNRNIDMSMGLREDKKLKPKTDQKDEKPSLPKPVTTASPSQPTLQPEEVFDSSRDNTMSEMKKVADMGPDEASKVFSHVEGKQQLDPLTTSVDDTIKRAVPENNLITNPVSSADKTLQERDRSAMESKDEDAVLMKDVNPEIHEDYKESKKQDQLAESVRFSDELNKDYRSSSLNNDKNNNPFISGIKLWQAYSVIWFNAYNEYMKTRRSIFKTIC